jgi:23S rRNA (uracil1939-C5)-methyltransferase/tRNA (uracil-5-)-methyltransferase
MIPLHTLDGKSRAQVKIGFRGLYSKNIIDIETCPVALPKINGALPEKRLEIFRQVQYAEITNKKKTELMRGGAVLYRGWSTKEGLYDKVSHDREEVVMEWVNGLRFVFRAGDFWQTNPSIVPLLVDYVVNEAAAYGDDHLVDAYCGAGLFAISAATKFTKVWGIEVSRTMVECAEQNARLNLVTNNCRFAIGQAEQIFSRVRHLTPETTCVIIDPPREGCSKEFMKALLTFRPHTVIYVSCYPATQVARDMSRFIERRYKVNAVQPFDMFPQSKHSECVVTMTCEPLETEEDVDTFERQDER